MENRLAKVNISTAGGTAAKGAQTCKVTLPTAWLAAMGVDGADREVVLSFDGAKINIARHLCAKEFATQKRAQGHTVHRLQFYDDRTLCTTIFADFTDKTLAVENRIDNPVKTAFGRNALPTWADFEAFLEERCVPRQRAGLREYLESLGIAEYAPLAIIEKTEGRMAEDHQWLKVEELP